MVATRSVSLHVASQYGRPSASSDTQRFDRHLWPDDSQWSAHRHRSLFLASTALAARSGIFALRSDRWHCHIPRGGIDSLLRFSRLLVSTRNHLTNRWSQPLAVVKRTFDFMKLFAMFVTVALASGGSAPSR